MEKKQFTLERVFDVDGKKEWALLDIVWASSRREATRHFFGIKGKVAGHFRIRPVTPQK